MDGGRDDGFMIGGWVAGAQSAGTASRFFAARFWLQQLLLLGGVLRNDVEHLFCLIRACACVCAH